MITKHRVNIGNSQNLKEIENESVNLIVTSPPYPMIEMWDEVFSSLNPSIADALNNENGFEAYDLMNKELNKVCLELGTFIIDDLVYQGSEYDINNMAFPCAAFPQYFNNVITSSNVVPRLDVLPLPLALNTYKSLVVPF